MNIVTVSQMQQAERESSRFGISLDMLMEKAGQAVAGEIKRLAGNLVQQSVLILVGPGNNGGDGLVAARQLFDWGTGQVNVYLCGKRPIVDIHLDEIKQRGIPYSEMEADSNLSQLNIWLSQSTIVLDAIFGTGKGRPISGQYVQVLKSIDESKEIHPDLSVIALDLPSGLSADTGSVDEVTPHADYTLTLGYPKIGLFNLPGAERAGKITILDIGIPPELTKSIPNSLITPELIKSVLPKRSPVSHKGTHGKVMALVGSQNYIGAAYLSCTSSIRAGAGLTTLAITAGLQPMLSNRMAEVTYLPLPELPSLITAPEAFDILLAHLPQYNVLLTGCGIGQSESITGLMKKLLLNPQLILPPIVLDADGISILAKQPNWWQDFKHAAILTPHAGEMSRLLNVPVETIQKDRIGITREAAAKWEKIVVLKGAYSIVASPEGQIMVSPFANGGLASAGTGDVLAGVISGLVSQGLTLFNAAICGVYLHGLAGEMVKSRMGDIGMLASDLLPVIPLAIRQLKEV